MFLPDTELKTRNLTEIHEEALKNLAERYVPIEISNHFSDPVLLASGDDFSAEKILDKTFLLEAQQTLNAGEIVISIPRRRCMMIVNRHCSKETLGKFMQLHGIAWQEDNYGNAPIFNGLFLAKDGQAQEVILLNDLL